MNRRQFLKSALVGAACFVLPIPIETASLNLSAAAEGAIKSGNTILTPVEITREALRILHGKLEEMGYQQD